MAAARLLLAVSLVIGCGLAEINAPPTIIRETVAAGFVLGFVSDSAGTAGFMTCEEDLRRDGIDLTSAVRDFGDALRQKSITKITGCLTGLSNLMKGTRSAGSSCQASVKEVESLLAALWQVQRSRDLGQQTMENTLSDGEKIVRDIQDSKKKFDGRQYLHAGEKMGQALRKALLGQSAASASKDVLV